MADFYLGREYDMASAETTDVALHYDPDDLTTHGVIVGMTGSGKTGLCLDIMEEAALNKTPALMIDPKGDITNTLLHFPDLAPSDFEPWINQDEARRSGKTVGEVAASTAELWRNGLASWDIGSDRIQKLADSAHFSIYTPGSNAGRSISILSSLAAPNLDWESNKEALREQIASTVTALLSLAGFKEVDPVTDREHILLANIFEHAWSSGNDLTLGDLIMHTQNPPFEKLGFFDVATFFPDKDRMKLALQLNNILASPAFQAWIEGEPLDIEALLFMPDGTPRHTVFYIAHLSDEERMFFVALFYGAVETWMRQQTGSGSLRALVYFDEIFGYLPPSKNPPSKEPMLRLLKQARAFGVGMLLATQNPVDIDYKALSNAGTWFIGKLGTDQDKQRLLDGLESAMGFGESRQEYDRMISSLGKRVFLLRNVHEKAPVLFQTRWAMNYLAGPITRARIGELNALVGADAPVAATPASSSPPSSPKKPAARAKRQQAQPTEQSVLTELGTRVAPKVPARISEFFLPINLQLADAAAISGHRVGADAEEAGIVYHPAVLAQAIVRLNNRKYNLSSQTTKTAVVADPDDRGITDWEAYQTAEVDPYRLDDAAVDGAVFAELMPPLNQPTSMTALKKDFLDWVYRESAETIWANEDLKLFGEAGEGEQAFFDRCMEEAKKQMQTDIDKIKARFDKEENKLETRLRKEKDELDRDETELAGRKREEMVRHAETAVRLLGALGGRRRVGGLSGSMTKRRMTSTAREKVEESHEEIERLEQAIEELDDQEREELEALRDKWLDIADNLSEVEVQPFKKDVSVDVFGVAWMPHFVVEDRGRVMEIPAYGVA